MKILSWGKHQLIFDAALYQTILANYGVCINFSVTGYKAVVCTRKGYRGKKLARVLMSCPKGMQVDHINGNSLDNRLENLRIVTARQNSLNAASPKNKTNSLPKGVTFSANKKSFIAQINIHRTVYNLGTHATVELAEEAYKEAADKFFGKFAAHNSRE